SLPVPMSPAKRPVAVWIVQLALHERGLPKECRLPFVKAELPGAHAVPLSDRVIVLPSASAKLLTALKSAIAVRVPHDRGGGASESRVRVESALPKPASSAEAQRSAPSAQRSLGVS